MTYLSAAEVLFIHSAIIEETGGSHGVRDLGLLESAVAQPQQSFDGQDLYKTVEEKAAALLLGLIKNHPFVDGNKRTALTACGVFLGMHGMKLSVDQNELAAWIYSLAAGPAESSKILSWIKRHTIPSKK